jgi:DNA polymerase IV
MRKIIHCDADCFFAAIEMRDDPSLRFTPMAVGGDPGRRGVISTCNYEARRFGIHSAMASAHALRLCPTLIMLPHNMAKYKEASQRLKAIFSEYTDLVEMFSIDEAYLDVTDSEYCQRSATLIARDIRQKVAAELGITVSAGVATTKFLAKVASEWRKPDGLYTIAPGQEQEFIDRLPVRYFQGVGKVTAGKMAKLGISTGKDIRLTAPDVLVDQFGSYGLKLMALSQGKDDRPVKTDRLRKSLSVERTFSSDLSNVQACLGKLPLLYEELQSRRQNLPDKYSITKLKVKIKFSNFSQTTLEAPGQRLDYYCFCRLVKDGVARIGLPVRLLGLGLQLSAPGSQLQAEQLELFPRNFH